MEGKVLVTGSNGQLGQCFKEVVGYYNRNYDYIFTTREEFDITNYDIMKEYLENNKDIKIIINCAAYTDVKKSESFDGFKQAMLINGIGPKNLAKVCNEMNIFLIHIGTEYIMNYWYYKNNNKPLNENDFNGFVINRHKDKSDVISINRYGYSKSMGINNIINEFNNKKNYLIIITSWLYSEYGDNFVKTMFNRIKNDLDTEVVYSQIGSPTYAKDLAEFINDIITNNYDMEFEDNQFINFANLGTASWYDIAKRVDIFEHTDKIVPRKEPFDEIIRPKYSVLDLSKVRNLVGKKKYLRHWTTPLWNCLDEISYQEEKNKK